MQAGENEELERSNAVKKGELKALKSDIEEMRAKSIETAQTNATSEWAVNLQCTRKENHDQFICLKSRY